MESVDDCVELLRYQSYAINQCHSSPKLLATISFGDLSLAPAERPINFLRGANFDQCTLVSNCALGQTREIQ